MAVTNIENSEKQLPFLYYSTNPHQIWWACCNPDEDDVVKMLIDQNAR